jgi:RES domain-containing protein
LSREKEPSKMRQINQPTPPPRPLADFVRPWAGTACRHIPDDSPFGVLDMRFAARARDNRWNRQGEPTLYLASDHDVLLAEFARHLRELRTVEMRDGMLARRIFDLDLTIARTLDLRDPQVCAALSLSGAPQCFLDHEIARATADFLRRTTAVEALLLPSMAFLDQPERWVMAIFLEKLPGGIDQVVTVVTKDGILWHED